MIEAIFAVFGMAAMLLFHFIAPLQAVAATCFVGWLLLPIGNFPEGSSEALFPYWIVGAALPSNMLLTKMWWAPVAALAGVLLTDRDTLARWRPRWIDVPILLWCLWPIGQWCFIADPAPPPWIAVVYLTGAWGAPWLLGRIYFSSEDGRKNLISSIVAGLAIIAPIALIEGVVGPRVYGWIYGSHPFRADGIERYVGFRPIGLFEHGSQYGIWTAELALAAIWLWGAETNPGGGGRCAVTAVLALVIAVASQSVGAILLMCMGLVALWGVGRPLSRSIMAIVFVLAVAGGALYLSGAVPLRTIAKDTVVGRQVVDILRSTGRGSITWRMARDQDALTLIDKHPILGTAQWDRWRKNDERPWGLALLVLGQFGVIGSALAFGSLLRPVIRALNSQEDSVARVGNSPAMPLALIVLMAIADALVNSFFFYPAILAVGALESNPQPCQVGEKKWRQWSSSKSY